jgi:hypothetical protein
MSRVGATPPELLQTDVARFSALTVNAKAAPVAALNSPGYRGVTRQHEDTLKITTKTGEKAPTSGQYRADGNKHEVTLVAGKRVPPSPVSNQFTLVDKTKHKKKPRRR